MVDELEFSTLGKRVSEQGKGHLDKKNSRQKVLLVQARLEDVGKDQRNADQYTLDWQLQQGKHVHSLQIIL